jgi:uncharacterized delta-60 repeat protein
MAMITMLLSFGYRVEAEDSPGDLDQSFGSGGKVLTSFASGKGAFYDCAYALAVQPDGKLVAAGATRTSDFALARYNPDGSLDPTFGFGGKVITDMGHWWEEPRAVGILPDGRIVVAGQRFMPPESSALACYNPDGSLDVSFGDGGKIVGRYFVAVRDMAIQADGRIIVAGGSGLTFGFVRFNPDGTLDASFGSGGTVVIPATFFYGATSVTLQSDGRIVAAGASVGESNEDFTLVRLLGDGSLDPTFGTAGVVRTNLLGYEFANRVAIAPDGRIVAAGNSRERPNKQPDHVALVRYNPDGSLDPSFGEGGKVTTELGDTISLTGLVIQPDGRIIVSNASEDFELVRYNSNGSLDSTFGSNGVVTTNFYNRHDEVHALALVSNDRLMAAGTSFIPDDRGYALESSFALACYVTTGTIKEPDFELGFNQPIVQARRGKKVTITVRINRVGGFTGDVTVAPPDPSAEGIICKIPDPITTSGTKASWKFKVRGTAAPGPHEFSFVGRDATGREHIATVTLFVE